MKQSKTYFYLFLLSGALIFAGACNKVSIPISFDFWGNTVSFEMPAVHTKGAFSVASVTTKTSIDSVKKANSAESLTIKTLKIKEATFTITAPSGQTFDAIDNLNLYISATGISEIKMASVSSIPKGKTSVSLTVNSTNLAQYFEKESITVRADGSTNDSIPNPVSMTLKPKYSVETN